jgi:hypothetical protein
MLARETRSTKRARLEKCRSPCLRTNVSLLASCFSFVDIAELASTTSRVCKFWLDTARDYPLAKCPTVTGPLSLFWGAILFNGLEDKLTLA